MVFTRVQILDFPQAHPGKCCFCGGQTNHDGRKYVDFGLSVPNYGAIVFCSHCFQEINDSLGWYSPEEHRRTIEDYDATLLKVEGLEKENERLRNALALLDFLPHRDASSSSDVVSFEKSTAKQRYADLKSQLDAERRAEAEAGTPESTNVGRSKDLQDPELAKLLNGSI